MGDPLAPFPLKGPTGLLFVSFLLVAVLIGATSFWKAASDARDDRIVYGEVTMRGNASHHRTHTPLVVVRLADGSSQTIRITQNQVQWCKIGARIEMKEADGKLRASQRGCNLAKPQT